MQTRLRLALAWIMTATGVDLTAAVSARVETVFHFNVGSDMGRTPMGHLVVAEDGTVFGTSTSGGRFNRGTIYRVRPDGTGFGILHHFTATGAVQGAAPVSGLMAGGDGYLYGTTESGTLDALGGTIYRMRTDGTGLQWLKTFGGRPPEARQPVAPLLLARDGRLYGTTRLGGANNFGVVYALQTDGTGFTVLHELRGAPGDGAGTVAGLCETPQGRLLGLASLGGQYHAGLLFRLDRDGTDFAALNAFVGTALQAQPFQALVSNPGGKQPTASLVQASNGFHYGTSSEGGARNGGTLFRVGAEGDSMQMVHSFAGAPYDGGDAKLALTVADAQRLLGATTRGGARNQGSLFLLDLATHQVQLLHSLQGAPTEGGQPSGPLAKGGTNQFVGTTLSGGRHGYGTLYRVTLQGL